MHLLLQFAAMSIREPGPGEMPAKDLLEVEGKFFYVIQDLDDLDLDPAAAGIDAVIFGHSHRPISYEKDGVLYFNPGGAG